MKVSVFSLSTDGINYQNLVKMNPVTLRIYDVNQHNVVTKFLDMCLSMSSTSAGIFISTDFVMSNYEIPWSNCIALGVNITSANVGKHKSLIAEVRKWNENVILMGCPTILLTIQLEKVLKYFLIILLSILKLKSY